MSTRDSKEVYLGDGLYASTNGYSVKLRAPREDGDHFVVLEPEVREAFEEYCDKVFGEKL